MRASKTDTSYSPVVFLIIALAFMVVGSSLPSSYAATSSSYQVDNDQAGPTHFQQSSSNYSLDGSIEPIVGSVTSTNYGNEQGSPTLLNATSSTTAGGGGGGGPQAGRITVDGQSCSVAYNNLVHFTGTKTDNLIYMFVRGEIAGFHFPDDTHWEKTIWLSGDSPLYDFFGRDEQGKSSNVVEVSLTLQRMGDINNDGKTNDYDLSILAHNWGSRTSCESDFNRDGITDDYDLSLLATYWTIE